MCFTHKTTLEKDGKSVRKYYITWLIDLANKLYDTGKFLISFYVICYLKLSCFIKKFCKQTCWIKFSLMTCVDWYVVVFIKYFLRKSVLWNKKEEYLTQLICERLHKKGKNK